MHDPHGRFVWYELMTTDIETAKVFYAHVVGWRAKDVAKFGSTYALFAVGDAAVAGLTQLPEDARKAQVMSHWTGYVGVGNVDASVDRLQQLGGRVLMQPADIRDVGRFAIGADPQMASFGLFQTLREDRPNADLSELGYVGWHELFAADWKTAFAFYGGLFGWTKADVHTGVMGTYQQFSVGGALAGGMFNKPPTLPLPFWLYYFNVDNIDAATARVKTAKGQILYGPIEVPGGAWIAHCLDPQGAIFALMERRGRKPVGYKIADPAQQTSKEPDR